MNRNNIPMTHNREASVVHAQTISDDAEVAVIEIMGRQDLAMNNMVIAKIQWCSPGYTLSLFDVNAGEFIKIPEHISNAMYRMAETHMEGINKQTVELMHLEYVVAMLFQVALYALQEMDL